MPHKRERRLAIRLRAAHDEVVVPVNQNAEHG